MSTLVQWHQIWQMHVQSQPTLMRHAKGLSCCCPVHMSTALCRAVKFYSKFWWWQGRGILWWLVLIIFRDDATLNYSFPHGLFLVFETWFFQWLYIFLFMCKTCFQRFGSEFPLTCSCKGALCYLNALVLLWRRHKRQSSHCVFTFSQFGAFLWLTKTDVDELTEWLIFKVVVVVSKIWLPLIIAFN